MQRICSPLRIFSTLVIILLLQLCVPTYLNAQENTISVSFNNASLKEAIKKIETLSSLQFVFADALLKNKPPVSASYQHATLAQVLQDILTRNGISYTQQGNNIILRRAKEAPVPAKSILSGSITDSKSKEPLIGAVIHAGALSAQTDMEGRFSMTLPVGTYKAEITYMGYKPVSQTLTLQEGKEMQLAINMSENPNAIGEVTITERRYNNTNIALIEAIKEARAVVSGISKEQITRSQDRDAAEVVRRVAGVSVMQNRFIVVRGMGQRYNTVMLNNAMAPSFEPDSRAFSFDIIPSGMIDRILIYKSAVPELPGDFAGGVIKVYTTGAPARNSLNISYQASYRPHTTFKDFYGQTDGKYAWLGYDDGTYKKPIDYSIEQNTDFASRMETTRKFNQNWVAENKGAALPDQRFNIDFGRTMPVSDAVKFGITGGLSYSNTKQYQVQYRNPRGLDGSMRYTASDEVYYRDIRLSGLLNASMNIGTQHQISFKNLYTHLGSTRYMYRRGYVPYDDMAEIGIPTQSNLEQYVQTNDFRGIYTGQLNGSHALWEGNTKVNWLASYTRSDFYSPDERRRTHTAPAGTQDWGSWLAGSFGLGTEGREQRVYWTVPEQVKTLGLDLEQKIKINNFQPLLKAGFYYENKDRSATYTSYAHIDSALVGGQTGGFNDYKAENILKAGYIAAEIPFLKKFKLYGGLRVEHNVQRLSTVNRNSVGPDTGAVILDLDKTTLLPSVNLSYNVTEKTLIRAAWYKTLNRPEFREISATQYYDMANNSYIYGNPKLATQADIDNIDLRLEHYPGPGEMLAIALFHKKIENPYELYSMASTSGIAYMWQNSQTARNFGAEIDMMLGLGRYINGKSRVATELQKISVLFNAAYVYSRLELGEAQRYEQQTDHRPLMGQSPYLINAGINYTDDSSGIKLNVSYNVIGKRIAVIGNRRLAAVWELPRHSLDFTFSKSLGKALELRGGVQNILNSRIVFGQDMNMDGKFDIVDTDYELFSHKEHDNRFMSAYENPYFTLGVALRL